MFVEMTTLRYPEKLTALLQQKPSQKRRLVATLMLLIASAVAGVSVADGQPQPPLRTVVLSVGGVPLITELAVTPGERQRGLSYRKVLDENAGMLFVYQQERPLILSLIHI